MTRLGNHADLCDKLGIRHIHHWARALSQLGHDARIIDPRFVAPYRRQGRSGKNDWNNAVAICEAAGRPQMHFVPVKSAHQQAVLVAHWPRTACVAEHTRTIKQMRGLLAEFGVIVPKGANRFKQSWRRLPVSHACKNGCRMFPGLRLCEISGVRPFSFCQIENYTT